MPFKSKAQKNYMFANMPDVAEKWAEETPNIKKLPQKVQEKRVATPQPVSFDFWVVRKPESHSDNPMNLVFKTSPLEFAYQVRGGMMPEEILGFYQDESEAYDVAHDQVLAEYKKAKALEEKKDLVATKLQKKIDELQKLAETHMKAMKSEPENAEAHQIKAESYLAKIKELRGKHKSVEKAKKPLEEKEGEDDLKHKKGKLKK